MDSLHFCFHGNPKHPALLFLHGFMGSAQDWQEIIAKLAKDYYCISVDLPGHGASACEFTSWEDFSAQLSGICEQFSPLNIVGYSMGGRIGLELMLRYPRLFERGLIISAHPGLIEPQERKQRYEADKQLLAHVQTPLEFEQFLRRWYQQPLFAEFVQHPSFEAVFKQRLQNDPSLLRQALELFSTGVMPSVAHQLQKLNFNYLYGEKDLKYKQLAQTELAPQKIPIAEIKAADHQVLVFPAEVVQHIRQHLS